MAQNGVNANYARFHYNQIDDNGAGNSSGNVFAYTAMVGPIYPLYIRGGDGRVLYTEDGIKRYDYGENAGMERSIFTNSNALSESRLNTQASEATPQRHGLFRHHVPQGLQVHVQCRRLSRRYALDDHLQPVVRQFASEEGIVQKGHSRRHEYNTQQILNYTKQIDRHNINVMVGHEYYNSDVYSLAAQAAHAHTGQRRANGAIIDSQNAASKREEYNNEGYFGRVMYDYASRYFFSASYRRDASSRFHSKHRWGNFWSLGGRVDSDARGVHVGHRRMARQPQTEGFDRFAG